MLCLNYFHLVFKKRIVSGLSWNYPVFLWWKIQMIVYLKFFFFTPLKLTFTFESGRTRLNHFYFPCKINFIFFKQSKEHAGLFLLPYVGSTVQIELARHPSSSDVHNASQQNQAVIFHLIQN